MSSLARPAPWGARSGPRTRVGFVLMALLACLGLVVPGLTVAGPAHAASQAPVTFTNVTVAKVDASNTPLPGQLEAGASNVFGLLSFDWDARGATPQIQAGDYFTMKVPDPFFSYRVADTQPLVFVPTGETLGECAMAGQLMTCTFNETMENKVKAGFDEAMGSVKVQLSVRAGTTSESLPFEANGSVIDVDLPGTGGIRVRDISYRPVGFQKLPNALSKNSTGVHWNFNFDTETIAAKSGQSFDGQTQRTISVNDTLGPGQACPAANTIALLRTSNADGLTPTPLVVFRYGVDQGTAEGPYSVKVTCDPAEATDEGTPVTFEITGPFPAHSNFNFNYLATTTKTATPQPGVVYTNTASVAGTELTSTSEASYVEAFEATVTMQMGYGTFSIAKYAVGPAAADAPADSSFTVNVSFELPADASSYAGWQPPGTMTDGRNGTATMEVALGKITTFFGPSAPVTFPKGTVVTLTEAAPDAPLPSGYGWGAGTFQIDKTTASTFTIADGAITPVELLNDTVRASYPVVSVGDYVWEDVNRDGLQDDTDKPIEGVELTISRSDGNPVNNPDGTARAELTTTTDANGRYIFEGLEVLPAGVHYIVTITPPDGYEPTIEGAGSDRGLDSSTGSAESKDLTVDGDSDLTLDFGFVTPEPPVTPTPSESPTPSVGPAPSESPEPSGEPTPSGSPASSGESTPSAKPVTKRPALARTGATILVPALLAGAALGSGALLQRRRQD